MVDGGLRHSQQIPVGDKDQSELFDSRILGNGDFVEQVLRNEEKDSTLTSPQQKQQLADEYIKAICTRYSITTDELCSCSRRHIVSKVRKDITLELVRSYGLTATEVARLLAVSTSAVCNILERN